MEPLTLLLVIVVLAGASAVAGHLIAKHTWPLRRELWRHRAELVEEEARIIGDESDLEKPEAGMGGEHPRPIAAAGQVHDARAVEAVPPAASRRTVRPAGRRPRTAPDRVADTDEFPSVSTAEPEPGRRLAGEHAGQNPRARLRNRRAAGLSNEDLDY